MSSSRKRRIPSKYLESESLEMAREKAIRSRWESGVREAALQMSRMRSGLVSVLRRERAARDFSLLVKMVFESGVRIDDADAYVRS